MPQQLEMQSVSANPRLGWTYTEMRGCLELQTLQL